MFFFNDTATTEIYTLSLHDALPISEVEVRSVERKETRSGNVRWVLTDDSGKQYTTFRPNIGEEAERRSEEHTSELQSRQYLVCRLLLEKKKREDGKHRLTG